MIFVSDAAFTYAIARKRQHLVAATEAFTLAELKRVMNHLNPTPNRSFMTNSETLIFEDLHDFF